MKGLKNKYHKYIEKVRASGASILSYDCPACKKSIETEAPSNTNECWDTITICPHCDGLHFKIVRHDSAQAKVVSRQVLS